MADSTKQQEVLKALNMMLELADDWCIDREKVMLEEAYDTVRRYIEQPQPDASVVLEQCYCDRVGLGKPGISCGDCPTRDYQKK